MRDGYQEELAWTIAGCVGMALLLLVVGVVCLVVETCS